MANLKEIRRGLHNNLLAELSATESFSAQEKNEILSCLDRAWTDILFDLLDGTAPQPSKRAYTRKKKTMQPETLAE